MVLCDCIAKQSKLAKKRIRPEKSDIEALQ